MRGANLGILHLSDERQDLQGNRLRSALNTLIYLIVSCIRQRQRLTLNACLRLFKGAPSAAGPDGEGQTRG
jgi:hypothetical protein